VTDQERREAVLKGRLQVCMSIKYIELKISMDLLGATQALGKTIRHCWTHLLKMTQREKKCVSITTVF